MQIKLDKRLQCRHKLTFQTPVSSVNSVPSGHLSIVQTLEYILDTSLQCRHLYTFWTPLSNVDICVLFRHLSLVQTIKYSLDTCLQCRQQCTFWTPVYGVYITVLSGHLSLVQTLAYLVHQSDDLQNEVILSKIIPVFVHGHVFPTFHHFEHKFTRHQVTL